MKIRTEKVIDVSDWDDLVEKTYGRPYSFQQQDGCKEREMFRFSVPKEGEDYDRDTVPEKVNNEGMEVSFSAWLKRDPKAPIADGGTRKLVMWWERNFYPDFQMVANDLHEKGLLEAGTYAIDIDW